MIQSFLVYGILVVFMTLLGIYSSYKQAINLNGKYSFWQIEIILSLLLFSLVSGMRYDVGVDFKSYLDAYESIKFKSFSNKIEFEPGFNWILKQFAAVDAHYSWVFGLLAFFQIFFLYFAFKKERYLYPYLSFVIITGGIYFSLMNEIRQGIATCIMIYAVRLVQERKLIPYIILGFAGFLIHRSAIIFIPIYLLLNTEKDFFKSIWLQLILLSYIIFLASTNYLKSLMSFIEKIITLIGYQGKYGNISHQMDIFEHDFTKGIRYYAPLIINIVIILYSKKLKKYLNSTIIIRYYNLYFLGALMSVLFYDNVIMQRPARYFTTMQIVISSYLLYYLWMNKKNNNFNLLIFAFIIILHIGILYAYVASNHHTRYLFFWDSQM